MVRSASNGADHRTPSDEQASVFAFGLGKGEENQLAWFSRLGAIRNRIAHPQRGTVSEEELAFIDGLAGHFERVAAPLIQLRCGTDDGEAPSWPPQAVTREA